MPIREPSVNPKSVEELQKGLRGAFGERLPTASGTGDVGDERAALPQEPMRAHPVYTADLADAAAGRALDSVRLVSWRYFVSEQEGAGRAAEVYWDETSDSHVFGGVTEGAFVDATLEALHTLERREEVERSGFEWRILRIPGLYVFAVWLRNESGGEDLIVPLGPTVDPLEAGSVYSARVFNRALSEPAKAVLEFEESRES